MYYDENNVFTRMTLSGETITSWTHSNLVEPMCIAVDPIYDHILIGDSSRNIHAFKAKTGQHLFTVWYEDTNIFPKYLFFPCCAQINNSENNGKAVECIGTFMAIGQKSQIIVISCILIVGYRYLDIYSSNGEYERSITIATTDKCK